MESKLHNTFLATHKHCGISIIRSTREQMRTDLRGFKLRLISWRPVSWKSGVDFLTTTYSIPAGSTLLSPRYMPSSPSFFRHATKQNSIPVKYGHNTCEENATFLRVKETFFKMVSNKYRGYKFFRTFYTQY